MIVVCTPTRNRRWSWEWSRLCMDRQELKPDHWIILDNSDDPTQDWSVAMMHPLVTYVRITGRRTIGELRNLCLEEAALTRPDYVVFWDDDDYYPPTRISSAVRALEAHPEAQFAGSPEMYVLLPQPNILMKVGPYGKNHATAATWTLRGELTQTHRFAEVGRGEEESFTKRWTLPMAEVPTEETIVVMGHSGNTVDKNAMAENPAKYMGTIVNAANGRMVARMRWLQAPEVWGRFRSTFVDASNVPPPGSTSS